MFSSCGAGPRATGGLENPFCERCVRNRVNIRSPLHALAGPLVRVLASRIASELVSFSLICQPSSLIMPGYTVEVSTAPTDSLTDREQETRASGSLRDSIAAGTGSDKERNGRRGAERGNGGAEFRVAVGDAYIRDLSGEE